MANNTPVFNLNDEKFQIGYYAQGFTYKVEEAKNFESLRFTITELDLSNLMTLKTAKFQMTDDGQMIIDQY